jgi:hypothetical protein
MPPSESGLPGGASTGAAAGASPAAGPGARRSGPTRAMPVALLAIAGLLLVARVALGIYEHAHPIVRPPTIQVPSIPSR